MIGKVLDFDFNKSETIQKQEFFKIFSLLKFFSETECFNCNNFIFINFYISSKTEKNLYQIRITKEYIESMYLVDCKM